MSRTKTTGLITGALALGTFGVFHLACSRSEAAPKKPVETSSESVPLQAKGDKNYKTDLRTQGACKVGEECKVVITLDAQAEYHINKEYPYKFTASASPDIDYLGKEGDEKCGGGKLVFSKCAGDFKEEGASKATMTVRFKPTKAGSVNVAGTYKLSVCSDQNCVLDSAKLELAVNVEAKK